MLAGCISLPDHPAGDQDRVSVTQETISGLLGLAFRQGVTIETDAATDYINKNIDGDGIGLEQQAKASMTDLIKYGRAGLFVDFPPTDGEVSKAKQARLALSATVNLYDAFSIVDCSLHLLSIHYSTSKSNFLFSGLVVTLSFNISNAWS